MKRRTFIAAAITAGLLASAYGSAVYAQASQAQIQAAIADTNRPQADKDRDAMRKPAEMMAFAGVKPGDKVVEFWPGGGYVTRLLSKIVGPTGKVYAINAPTFPDRLKDQVKAVTGNSAYSNVTVLEQPFSELKVPEPVDVVWTSENYHDFQNQGPFKTDTAAMDKAVFAALKPGGTYIITDYVSAPGSGKTQTQALHRIEPAVIRQEVQAAGFMFVEESNALMNASDNLTERSRQGASQIMLKFRKPR